MREHYALASQALHPIFDVKLFEGALAKQLRQPSSELVADLNAQVMQKIVGQSQIGRLRFALLSDQGPKMPTENLRELLAHCGAHELFESLLSVTRCTRTFRGPCTRCWRAADHAGLQGPISAFCANTPKAPYVCPRFSA